MAIKLITVGEYRRAIIQLRRFADGFEAHDPITGALTNFAASRLRDGHPNPLTQSQRRRIRDYFDVLQRHAGYKGVVFKKSKNPKKLAEMQKAMGMPTRQTWRGVFVPQPSEKTPVKLVKRKNIWLLEYAEQGVDTVFVPFDKMAFATHGTSYVRGLFHGAPDTYKYNLDMGYGRNRWKAGGNLEQMLRDLEFMFGIYDHISEFVKGVHVYRATWDEFNKLKSEHEKTMKEKRRDQEKIKKLVSKERRAAKREREKADKANEKIRDDRNNVRWGYMTRSSFFRKYGFKF